MKFYAGILIFALSIGSIGSNIVTLALLLFFYLNKFMQKEFEYVITILIYNIYIIYIFLFQNFFKLYF